MASRIKKGDQVVVLSGKYRGKSGRVLRVVPKKDRLVVEGINVIKRSTRPSQRNPKGGIIELEAPIHISNVKLKV